MKHTQHSVRKHVVGLSYKSLIAPMLLSVFDIITDELLRG